MGFLVDTSTMARGSRGGRAMGDVPADPVAQLIAQVNRFDQAAPATYRYVTTRYPVASGNLPPAVAVTAAQIFYRRAQDAVVKFGDRGSADLLKLAGQAVANPTAWVGSNMSRVTLDIRAFADSLGIAPAVGAGPAATLQALASIGGIKMAAAVGAAALAFLLLRKGR